MTLQFSLFDHVLDYSVKLTGQSAQYHQSWKIIFNILNLAFIIQFLFTTSHYFEQQLVSTIRQSDIRILAVKVTEIYPRFWNWLNCNNSNCLILYQQSVGINGTTSYPQSHNRNLSVCCQWLSLTKLLFWSQTKSGKLDLWWSQVKSSA